MIVTDINETEGRSKALELSSVFKPLDVSSEQNWSAIAKDIPTVDIVVNNAGITGFETLTDTGAPPAHDPENANLADWRAVHAVNNDGTFLGCRYAIRAMRPKGKGSIINISSRSGLVGIPMAAAYAASKAAICKTGGVPTRIRSIRGPGR